jgi:hypothetical protein
VSISFAKKSKTDPYEVLRAVLASPSTVFLRRLDLTHLPAAQFQKAVETLLEAKARPPLRELALGGTLPEELLAAFPFVGRPEREKVEASDGPLDNVAIDKYPTVEEYAQCCATRMFTRNSTKANFGLPILEPKAAGNRPNRAAIKHAIERVVAGALGIAYTEPRQRAAATHLIYWLEQIGDPVPKALRSVAIGPKASR